MQNAGPARPAEWLHDRFDVLSRLEFRALPELKLDPSLKPTEV